jgi:hypothetical protein
MGEEAQTELKLVLAMTPVTAAAKKEKDDRWGRASSCVSDNRIPKRRFLGTPTGRY